MNAAPPRLLVSVRDANEAGEALVGGADWIDLKEPRRGALGAVDVGVARDVVDAVEGRTPISAAAGELLDWGQPSTDNLLGVPGISLVKLGLAGCRGADAPRAWRTAFDEIAASGKQLAAVVYVDAVAASAPPLGEQLAAAADSPARWILWDTFKKSGGGLVDALAPAALAAQLAVARTAGKRIAVAGQLCAEAIPHLPLELIDMIAVRGAVCEGPRDAAVCRARVAELRSQIARHADCSAVGDRAPSRES